MIPGVDWSLMTCARKGHITYAPTETSLRERLHVPTPAGEAWRCLRCGTYVHGEAHGSGPAEDAPLRGGKKAHEAHLHAASLIEVEQAAVSERVSP